MDGSQVPASRVPRRLLLAAAAGGAGALVGWRLWPAARETAEPLPAALWSQRFVQPGGAADLVLQAWRGQRLLINFWATWCPPCVEELPLLDRFARVQQAQGLQVLGLAVDQPQAVRAFLQRMPLGFPVGITGPEGMTWAKALGNPAGGLPFSILLGSDGRVRQRKIGKLAPDELAAWAGLH